MAQAKEKGKRNRRIVLAVVIVLAIFVLVVMAINARKPGRLDLGQMEGRVKGEAFIQANLAMIEQMQENWLPNDMFWPTVLLDNMPNFQIGQLEVSVTMSVFSGTTSRA